MKLADALRRVNESRAAAGAETDARRITLACGFTPLHFQTFLHAALLERSQAPIALQTGLFGDLVGTVAGLAASGPVDAVVPIEWSDLDPRLGLRTTTGWRATRADDIAEHVALCLARLRDALATLPPGSRAAVSLPTLPLPPLFREPEAVASALALTLRAGVHEFGVALARLPSVRVLDPQSLDLQSPAAERADPRGELRTGFPYQLPHASQLASSLAALLAPDAPKKGLITDLDDTLWRGLVGEDGVDAICWDLAGGAQVHGLYQEVLSSLLETGVLVGVASKNEAEPVQRALARADLVLDTRRLFPVHASWQPKSHAVAAILEAWNVDARDVVFVDDSPLELAEVSAAFPALECLAFPTHDEAAALALLRTLRARFGTTAVHDEDALRAASLRAQHESRKERAADPERFLASAEAELVFAYDRPSERCLELLNKTNQFNLNGRRWDEARWARTGSDPQCFVLAVDYRDKFGPLGTIAVVCGRRGPEPVIDAWVMSCRAFSRRIEHQVLAQLFDHCDAARIRFDFTPTERNAVLREFFASLGEDPSTEPLTLDRARFEAHCPALYAEIRTP